MPPSNTNTEIALIKQEILYIKDFLAKMDGKIDGMSKVFATKEELAADEKRIGEIENDKKAIIKWIILSFIGIIGSLVGITKYL